MAAETLVPDGLLTSTNLTGGLSAIDTDDTTWLVATANNMDSICIVSFPTPTGNPTTGAGLQNFTLKYRNAAGVDETTVSYNAYLLESGTRINGGAAIDSWTNASVTEITRQITWDAALLGTADGSLVELEVYVTANGGSPANRATGEFQFIDWDVDYSTATPTTIDLTAATFDYTAQATQNATTIEPTAATFNFTTKPVNALYNQVYGLTSAAFNLTAQSLQNAVVVPTTAATLNFTANNLQNTSVASLTAAVLTFTAQTVQNKIIAPLGSALINFTTNAINVTVPGPGFFGLLELCGVWLSKPSTGAPSTIDLTSATFNFTAKALQNSTIVNLASTTFNYTANAVTALYNQVWALTTATFNFTTQTIQARLTLAMTSSTVTMTTNPVQMSMGLLLAAGSFIWSAKDITQEVSNTINLTTASFIFTTNQMQIATVISLSTASLTFVAKKITIVGVLVFTAVFTLQLLSVGK